MVETDDVVVVVGDIGGSVMVVCGSGREGRVWISIAGVGIGDGIGTGVARTKNQK